MPAYRLVRRRRVPGERRSASRARFLRHGPRTRHAPRHLARTPSLGLWLGPASGSSPGTLPDPLPLLPAPLLQRYCAGAQCVPCRSLSYAVGGVEVHGRRRRSSMARVVT